ncbi:hypothetical protein GCM10022226_62480 [Sphaerisporangium flaviroseum]|uniref:Ribbon-helix-helix protein CopG domain-containing protein n=1 Tax=Sphaerisporangium flaviroseum TaxID=509199 RepID=A0ABP7J3G2_9ACTN
MAYRGGGSKVGQRRRKSTPVSTERPSTEGPVKLARIVATFPGALSELAAQAQEIAQAGGVSDAEVVRRALRALLADQDPNTKLPKNWEELAEPRSSGKPDTHQDKIEQPEMSIAS